MEKYIALFTKLHPKQQRDFHKAIELLWCYALGCKQFDQKFFPQGEELVLFKTAISLCKHKHQLEYTGWQREVESICSDALDTLVQNKIYNNWYQPHSILLDPLRSADIEAAGIEKIFDAIAEVVLARHKELFLIKQIGGITTEETPKI